MSRRPDLRFRKPELHHPYGLTPFRESFLRAVREAALFLW
ncbi:hypothetical protein C8D95_102473 [Silicimonas algicola]|uniref:Uncharacterized protein n=1 Tax=Silicimonas algicola TaxID=1826607 RepID=A0A316GA89_9RHOB|nr:hypothetical protein C8D95_102473 [Silicimonas algicola]